MNDPAAIAARLTEARLVDDLAQRLHSVSRSCINWDNTSEAYREVRRKEAREWFDRFTVARRTDEYERKLATMKEDFPGGI